MRGSPCSDVPLDKASYFTDLSRRLADHLYRSRTVAVFRNKGLKLYSRVGEDREAFAGALPARPAEAAADAETAKLEEKYRTQDRSRSQAQLSKAESRVRELEAEASARNQQSLMDGRRRASRGAARRQDAFDLALQDGLAGPSGRRRAAPGCRRRRTAMGEKAAEVEQLETDLAADLEDDHRQVERRPSTRSRRSRSAWRRPTSPSTNWYWSGSRADQWISGGAVPGARIAHSRSRMLTIPSSSIVLHHREMAVPRLEQPERRLLHLDVGRHRVRLGRHPLADGGAWSTSVPAGDGAEQVALGDQPHQVAPVDDTEASRWMR